MADYKKWESVYQNPGEPLPWELGRPRPALVDLIESGKVRPEGRALDICCGLGTNTIYLAKSGFQAAGIDISETAIRKAREKAEGEGVPVRFLVANSVKLPFRDREFNFVFDMGCFHHIRPEDRDGFITGVSRVLEKGGWYFMTCFSDRMGKAWNHFSPSDIERIFSGHFEIESMKTVSSLEGDNAVRYFNSVLMRKK